MTRSRIDDIDGDLIIESCHLAGDGRSTLYTFSITTDNTLIAQGEAMVTAAPSESE
jgi:hypothetical protein